MYICRHCLDHLLPPCTRRGELLLIRRVFWKIERSRQDQELEELECCCSRQLSPTLRLLCCDKELGTSDRKHIPTPREDLPHRELEGVPKVSPREVLDQGLVVPSSSTTSLLCNLGHITPAHGDTTHTCAEEPSPEPGLGREETTSDRYGCKNNLSSFGQAVPRHYLTREGRSSIAIYLCGVQKSALCSAARPPRA